MGAPKSVQDLVAQFTANPHHYKSSTFKETPTREQFVNPLFEALGWNVRSAGLSETEKEVVLEQPLTIGGTTNSIDYAFRVDGVNKFVVEAKPPHKNLQTDGSPALQIRRYGWNLGLPLGIVTDFEEFAIYDCRVRPESSDDVRVARVNYFRYDQYGDAWNEISGLFSRNAVLAGSIDEWAATAKRQRGTVAVDEAFLNDISGWREALARDLVRRNPALTSDELNFAVQATIDRIVFLRICEDRGLEREGDLLDTTRSTDVYPKLLQVFGRADQRYNSGLFHFKNEKDRSAPDSLTPNLQISDGVLREIISNLYGPRNVYEFRAIPTDILGRVYEQFLGKIIERTGKAVRIVEKPEVKKAGGVYYTPEWVVEYIVTETLRPLLARATLAEASRIRVLDPACGSGSFLLGAFQYLLDWHLDYHTNRTPTRRKNQVARDAYGNWRLTLDERRRILLNNIFGVDLDPQAVEVAKLSLLLKVIEGESQLAFAVSRLLPDLDNNLKQGNSLVNDDVFELLPDLELTHEQWRTMVPFDWAAEFPTIMSEGGFTAVIGNPPYLSVDAVWGANDPRLRYLKAAYPKIHTDKTDVLFYFLQRANSLSKGETAMIVSRAFLEAFKAKKLRTWLGANVQIREIVDFQNTYVFPKVGITTAIVRFTHAKRGVGSATARQFLPEVLPPGVASRIVRSDELFRTFEVPQKELGASSWTFADPEETAIHSKVDAKGEPIGSILHIGQGMQTGANTVFGGLCLQDAEDWALPQGSWFRRARNSDILRWHVGARDEVLLFSDYFDKWSDVPPSAQKYLNEHKHKLRGRAAHKRGDCNWWQFTWPLHADHNDRARILCPYLATENRFALDENCTFLGLTDTTILYDNGQPEDLRWFVGILNSKLLTFRFRNIGKLKSAGIREYFENTVSQLVVPRTTRQDAAHQKMVRLVWNAESAAGDLAKARTDVERRAAEAKLHGAERSIDQLVYSLYSLTPDEVAGVERATRM